MEQEPRLTLQEHDDDEESFHLSVGILVREYKPELDISCFEAYS